MDLKSYVLQDKIISNANFCQDLEDHLYDPSKCGKKLGMYGLDNILGGLRPAELSVLIGHTGIGKSTFAMNMALWACEAGLRAIYLQFENTDVHTKLKMMEISSGLAISNPAKQDVKIDKKSMSQIRKDFDERYKSNLSFLNKDSNFFKKKGYFTLEEVISVIKEAKEFGYNFVIIDHLHYFLCTGNRSSDRVGIIDEAVRDIGVTTRSLGIHTLILVHPSKPQQHSNGEYADCGLYSSKGSSTIVQEADNFFTIKRDILWTGERDNVDQRNNIMVLKVLKNRWLGDTGTCIFSVLPNNSTYRNPMPGDVDKYKKQIKNKKRNTKEEEW